LNKLGESLGFNMDIWRSKGQGRKSWALLFFLLNGCEIGWTDVR
jgi:hypothetical protein